MTRLAVRPRTVPGWVQGLIEGAEPGTLALGTISDGGDLVPTPAGRMRARGGSRIVATLSDDNGSPAELSHVCGIVPFTAVGALVIGYSATEAKHYAYRMTSDMDFSTGTEATSRHDLTAGVSSSWDNASLPGRPVMAEIWEKMFLADAVTVQADRNELLGIDSAGNVTSPQFAFGTGAASPLLPYCVEEYNGVLFIAGYGTEDAGDLDRPEMLRHSFLGRDPGATVAVEGFDGFDLNAWALIGAKGQRITALRKGRGLLLVAKDDEFYRVSGFGRAYAGFQYQIEQVEDTQGLGIANPKALTFAEGFWWGVSAQGPIRTDGYTVQLLVGPRRPSWRGIDKVEDSWVAYHPERRLMLFGLHPTETETGRSATYPWRVWAWDMERSVWQPNHEFGADLFHVSAVTTTTAEGPTASPSSPVTSSETTTGYTASWTNGDAAAQTEFWDKDPDTGTWAIVSVIAAGTATYARTGATNHKSYYWRVRHRQAGVPSAWDVDAGTIAQTLASPPDCVAAQVDTDAAVNVTLTQFADGTDLVLERQIDGGYAVIKTYSAQASGMVVYFDGTVNCGTIVDYRARSRDALWPADSLYSSVSQVDLTADCTGGV